MMVGRLQIYYFSVGNVIFLYQFSLSSFLSLYQLSASRCASNALGSSWKEKLFIKSCTIVRSTSIAIAMIKYVEWAIKTYVINTSVYPLGLLHEKSDCTKILPKNGWEMYFLSTYFVILWSVVTIRKVVFYAKQYIFKKHFLVFHLLS